MTYKYDSQKILDLTNGGLDVILHLYPELDKVGGKWGKVILNFESEKTASSYIVPKTVGTDCVVVKSFSSGDAINCFKLVQLEYNLKFYEACKWIADNLNLDIGDGAKFSNAGFEMKEAEPDQKHDDYIFEYNDTFSEFELETLGKLVKDEHCTPFRLLSCKSFTQIKEYPADKKEHKSKKTHKYAGKTMQIITKASESYPIFVFEYGSWQKIYQPLSADKSYRFRYAGKKPENFVFGLDVVKEKFEQREKEVKKYLKECEENKVDPDPKKTDPRLDNIIIGSGDRDSINIYSLGFDVIWLNSETAVVNHELTKQLYKYAKYICYCGDIDDTGIEQAIKTAKQNISIKIVWLPEELKDYSYRGKPKKDVKDLVDIKFNKEKPDSVKKYFFKLVLNSVSLKYWYELKKGRKPYDISMKALLQFFWLHGFHRFKEEFSKKDDYTFIQLKDNIVYESDTTTLQNFPIYWLEENLFPIKLIDYMHTTASLNKDKLKRLPIYKANYNHTGKDYQYQFYQNKIWKITPTEILQIPYGKADTDVHESKIIQHNARVQKKKFFEIFTNDDGKIDIKILRKDNDFFNFIINTSRLHWAEHGLKPYMAKIKQLKADIEDEKQLEVEIEKVKAKMTEYRKEWKNSITEDLLTDEQNYEQRLSLINKLYAYGYLLHRYKEASKAFSPIAMDNKVSESSSNSNGRSGKSLLMSLAIQHAVGFENAVEINGRKDNIEKDQFVYSLVTRQTNVVIFNDIKLYFPMDMIYNSVTDGFEIEKKGIDKITLRNEESPKICTISNFGLPDYENSSSTKARLLPVPFSDYYHSDTSEYLDKHQPSNDYGKQFFQDWEDAEYNDFYNFNAQCIQLKMNQPEPIQAISDNIKKRNRRQSIGDTFFFWANDYFTIDRLNTFIPMNDFKKAYMSENSKLTSKKINDKLIEWCEEYNFEFNPDEYKNTQGYITKRIDGHPNPNMQTCIYIKTPQSYLDQYEANNSENKKDDNYDDGDNITDMDEDDTTTNENNGLFDDV